MDDRGNPPPRAPNLRTALVLLSIAIAFFIGVIAKRAFFD